MDNTEDLENDNDITEDLKANYYNNEIMGTGNDNFEGMKDENDDPE